MTQEASSSNNVVWNSNIQDKFNQMIAKIPPFLRPIAQNKVAKKAEALALKENRKEVSEKDMIDAFFIETPFGFHGPMKTDMEDLDIDYTKFGYKK
jgi:hypothetical protein